MNLIYTLYYSFIISKFNTIHTNLNSLSKLNNIKLLENDTININENMTKNKYEFVYFDKENNCVLDLNYINNENIENDIKALPLKKFNKKDNLRMLSSDITIELTKKWIHDMVLYKTRFPTFMYQDMFVMRDFAIQYTSNLYFYIGYFPSDIKLFSGPYYISVFELIPAERSFSAHMIVQNPNYVMEDDFADKRLISFKNDLENMCKDASVFFYFNNLKNKSNNRYHLSWFYEDYNI